MKKTCNMPSRFALPFPTVAFAIFCLAVADQAIADPVSGPGARERSRVAARFCDDGSAADRELDYAERRGDNPTVYVFISQDAGAGLLHGFSGGVRPKAA